MPDKIVNHFVLADGSTAKYDATQLAGDVPEVVGIRTGYDGVVYSSAGDAVRGQVGVLNNAVDNIVTITIGDNLVNTDTLTTGAVQSDGSISVAGAWATYATSDYISLEQNTDYIAEIFYKSDLSILNDRRILLLYDSNKMPVSGSYINTYGSHVTSFNSGTTYKYVRMSSASTNYLQLEKGTEETAYKPYEETIVLNDNFLLTSAMKAEIEPISENIDNIAHYHVGKNLINENVHETGAIQSNGSISQAGSFANYSTSDFIPVSSDTAYFLGIYNKPTGVYDSNARKLYLLYDASKQPLTQTWVNMTGDCTFIPEQDGFIRVSWATVANVMLELGNTHTTYEAYYNALLLNDEIPLTSAMRNELSNALGGKKWAHCGDSFSDYTNKSFENGVFANKYTTFPRLIAEKNGMDLMQEFMLSGRTLAYPADGTFTNSLTCPTNLGYYQNIPEDIDYITIMLGINDCQHTGGGSTGDGEDATGVITLGTIDDVTTATYYGAYNTVLGWLRDNRPFAHIGIIVTNGTTRQDYTEAQIAIAKKWGFPVLNLNGDERTPTMIRAYNPNIPETIKEKIMQKQAVDYSGNNTHPNWQTHEYESTFIEEWLRTL